MLRCAYTLIFLLSLVVSIGCSDGAAPQFKFPKPTEVQEGCGWKNAKLSVFNNKTKFVKFRYISCYEKNSGSVYVQTNGNDIIKLSFDIVDGNFSIFEHKNIHPKAFVQQTINKHSDHDGICKPVKIKENVWKIDDGKSHDADINFMPCGRYGRNFSGETFFIFKDNVAFNFQMSGEHSYIDFSSVEYQSE